MDADLIIAEHYNAIVQRVNSDGVSSLSESDRTIWYIVSARCEKDMEGFESIFVQFVSEHELLILSDSLRSIDEPDLAEFFDRAREALQRAGYFLQGSASYWKIGNELRKTLEEIEDLVGDRMWGLDDKLARLVGGNPPATD